MTVDSAIRHREDGKQKNLNIKKKQRKRFFKSIQGKTYSYRRCGKKIQPMCKKRSQRRPKHWKRTNTIICKIKNILELEKQKF